MVDFPNVWQTAKYEMVDSGGWGWRSANWTWNGLDDAQAEEWVEESFAGSGVHDVWDDLPTIILVRDLFLPLADQKSLSGSFYRRDAAMVLCESI